MRSTLSADERKRLLEIADKCPVLVRWSRKLRFALSNDRTDFFGCLNGCIRLSCRTPHTH
jgi:hypothetical protein